MIYSASVPAEEMPAMTFADELAEIRRMALQRRGPETMAAYERGVRELQAGGMAGRAAAVGTTAPDFALPDAHGRTVALGSLLARGPLVLTFYRGGWCPYCNLELRAYDRLRDDIRATGADLVAISPEVPDESLSTAEKNALRFDVLSDAGNRVARAYGLVFRLNDELVEIYRRNGNDLERINGDASWELPVPGTFVVGADGRIAGRFVDPDYTRRQDPEEVLALLRRLSGRSAA